MIEHELLVFLVGHFVHFEEMIPGPTIDMTPLSIAPRPVLVRQLASIGIYEHGMPSAYIYLASGLYPRLERRGFMPQEDKRGPSNLQVHARILL